MKWKKIRGKQCLKTNLPFENKQGDASTWLKSIF